MGVIYFGNKELKLHHGLLKIGAHVDCGLYSDHYKGSIMNLVLKTGAEELSVRH